MKRTENELDSCQVLTVIEKYNEALELLDSYDHQNMTRPSGNIATYELTYEECREVIKNMRFGDESDLLGKEKDDSKYLSIVRWTGYISYIRRKGCAFTIFCYEKS